MKLIIKRDQADVKGFFGGHKGVNFSLSIRVEITQEEKELIDRYKVGDYLLVSSDLLAHMAVKEGIRTTLSINDLTNGKSFTVDSISTLLKLEEEIKNGCQNLKDLLMVMRTFGGEEVLEI